MYVRSCCIPSHTPYRGYLPHEYLPVFTFVGSPNFGHRSTYRDIECQHAIFTSHAPLRRALQSELEHLTAYGHVVTATELTTPPRKPAWLVALVTSCIAGFF
eukprot:m.87125 g.87125  ORF g.87125 m.87125 type:complete len:102 (+) comp9688_c0_seq2:1037-1342(+)